jgi:DNA-directed RNA polymerase sigma subunit (sigma70/sigma32)
VKPDKPEPERPHHVASNKEIGEALGVSPQRIDQLASRAIQKLREELRRRNLRLEDIL